MSTKKTLVRKVAKTPTKPAPAEKVSGQQLLEPQSEPKNKDLLRKRELVERVALRAGVKKKDVKPIVEVMLAEIGKALSAGRGCALPPLGRIKINREKELPDGRVVILKLRQKTQPASMVANAHPSSLTDE